MLAMATAIFCGDSCAWAPVFTKPGGLFARPLRSNRTGQSSRIALIQKSAVPLKAQVEDPSDLLLQVEVDSKDSFDILLH